MSDKETNFLCLKWGTIKGWKFSTDNAVELFKKYHDIGFSYSAALQRDTLDQKKIICELIDLCDDHNGIFLDYENKYVTKDEAKKYIMNYHKE